jgi:hypothetical protein
MTADTKIDLSYPCGFFRPGDAEDPIAGEFQIIDGAVWPKTARVFWGKLRGLEDDTVCTLSGGSLTEDGLIQITSLNENWSIDTEAERVIKSDQDKGQTCDEWDRQIPFLILVYLVSARNQPVTYDMVLPRDLFPGFDLFRNGLDVGIHGVEKTFGHDGEGFLNAARRLGGGRLEGGDVAARFHIFPKFPVDYILWLGDSEFPANLTILVDRNAPRHLSADAIGVGLNLLSLRLCQEAEASR